MFRKAALSLTALARLTIANAQASSAVVVSSNGYYAAAWGQLLSKEQAIAKATAICQERGLDGSLPVLERVSSDQSKVPQPGIAGKATTGPEERY